LCLLSHQLARSQHEYGKSKNYLHNDSLPANFAKSFDLKNPLHRNNREPGNSLRLNDPNALSYDHLKARSLFLSPLIIT